MTKTSNWANLILNRTGEDTNIGYVEFALTNYPFADKEPPVLLPINVQKDFVGDSSTIVVGLRIEKP